MISVQEVKENMWKYLVNLLQTYYKASKSKHVILYFTKVLTCNGLEQSIAEQSTDSESEKHLSILFAYTLLYILYALRKLVFLCADAFLLISSHKFMIDDFINICDDFNFLFTTVSSYPTLNKIEISYGPILHLVPDSPESTFN